MRTQDGSRSVRRAGIESARSKGSGADCRVDEGNDGGQEADCKRALHIGACMKHAGNCKVV